MKQVEIIKAIKPKSFYIPDKEKGKKNFQSNTCMPVSISNDKDKGIPQVLRPQWPTYKGR